MADETAQETTPELVPLALVYTGRILDRDGKIQYAWIESGKVENGKLAGKIWYWKKQIYPAAIGVCIVLQTVPKPDGGFTYWTSGAKGPTVNGPISGFIEQIKEWEARDIAAAGELRRIQANARLAKSQPRLTPHIEALNRAYWQIPANQREAYVAHVLHEIMKYKRDK